MKEAYNPLLPWPQWSIDKFAAALENVSDEKILKLEKEWRCYETRESLISEDNKRLFCNKFLPSETDSRYETFITLYINLYNGTRHGLIAEIRKRGLLIDLVPD